jgi:CHAT domain-containing protein
MPPAASARCCFVRSQLIPRAPLRPRGQALSILAVGPHSGLDPDLRAEERAARQLAWHPLVESGALIVEELSPAVPQRLIERIQDGPPIDIIHYFGHGRYRNGKGELLFDRQGGGRVLLGADRVAALFGEARLALLFACQSSASGPAGLLTGVAPALVAAGVPAVVAMQLSVRADAAVRFAGRIYSALARGESLQQAMARARQVLFVEEEDGVSWFVPTLTIRSREARPIRLVGAEA